MAEEHGGIEDLDAMELEFGRKNWGCCAESECGFHAAARRVRAALRSHLGASQPSASGEPVAWVVEWEYDTGARLQHCILGDQPELARRYLASIVRDQGFKSGTVRPLGYLDTAQPSGSGTESGR